jgi:hypothetical protein
MAKRKTVENEAKKPLDKSSQKQRRGPKRTVSPSAVRGRADNWRAILATVWSNLWPALSKVETESDVASALHFAAPYEQEFSPQASLISKILKDAKFPKRQQARINFLADSSAGLGVVTPRRSRDICSEERARTKRVHQILRYEFYVECSCGYKGHSSNHGCALCGAAIMFPLGLGSFMA